MWYMIQQLDADHIFVLTIIGLGVTFLALVSLVPAVAYQWRQVRNRDAATEVVHSMLQQGSSVDEIERILRAGGFSQSTKDVAPVKWGCGKMSRRHGYAYGPSSAEQA